MGRIVADGRTAVLNETAMRHPRSIAHIALKPRDPCADALGVGQ
jgi:hypothetical protein